MAQQSHFTVSKLPKYRQFLSLGYRQAVFAQVKSPRPKSKNAFNYQILKRVQ